MKHSHFSDLYSPTAIALGSSAIVKVSGQNCFRTLYGSLGQIRLGPPESSVEGSTRFRQGSSKGAASSIKCSPSFVVSLVVRADLSVLGCQKVPRKFPPRFHRGSTKVAQVS